MDVPLTHKLVLDSRLISGYGHPRHHEIEFDFGNKWAESIGQALYDSIQTEKKAGIVLILKKQSDYILDQA